MKGFVYLLIGIALGWVIRGLIQIYVNRAKREVKS